MGKFFPVRAMKTYGTGGIAPLILNHGSCCAHRGKGPHTPWIEGWVGPRARLDFRRRSPRDDTSICVRAAL